MPKKVREVLEMLNREGWELDRQRAATFSSSIATKPGTVTVAGRGSVDMAEGTYRAILKQAGLK